MSKTAGNLADKNVSGLAEGPASPASTAARTKETLQLVSTALPIIGALGTAFVWATANFYVGDLEIVTDHPYQTLMVDVYDRKGKGCSYQVNKFQLMPGQYHLEISADGKPRRMADVNVRFNQNNKILVALNYDDTAKINQKQNSSSTTQGQQEESAEVRSQTAQKHQHWWQLWHRSKKALPDGPDNHS